MNTTTKQTARALACLGVAGIITLGLFSPAMARPNEATTSITVRFGDLDLAKPAGIEELYKRIRKAADKACGGYPSGQVIWQKQNYRQCREMAVARAVQDVDNGQLTALHAGSKGKAVRFG